MQEVLTMVIKKKFVLKLVIATSGKRPIGTGSRGQLVPVRQPVPINRDKRSPPLVPVPYEPVLKGPPRGPGGARGAGYLWYRFVTRTGTKGWPLFRVFDLFFQGLGFRRGLGVSARFIVRGSRRCARNAFW